VTVNTVGAEILYKTVADWCKGTDKTTVLDVCCGTGTIGLTVAKVTNLNNMYQEIILLES